MNDWQPIATAPKDGTEFLAFFPNETPTIAVVHHSRYDDVEFFQFSENLLSDVIGEATDWTHWMPLPPPPGAAADEP